MNHFYTCQHKIELVRSAASSTYLLSFNFKVLDILIFGQNITQALFIELAALSILRCSRIYFSVEPSSRKKVIFQFGIESLDLIK